MKTLYEQIKLGRRQGLGPVYLGYVLVLALLSFAVMAEAQVPASAAQFERQLTREARAVFGPEAPVARLAAQLHKESSWRPDVCSWAGACGLAQFMPATAADMAERFPRQLSPADPTNPAWAIQAQVLYNDWLLNRISAANGCEHWAMTLSAYNGGIGWLGRDRRLAEQAGDDPDRWFGQVDQHTARADWARRENRAYVTRILLELEPVYAAAGWAGSPVCPWPDDPVRRWQCPRR